MLRSGGLNPTGKSGLKPRRAARFLLSLPDGAPYRAPVLPRLALHSVDTCPTLARPSARSSENPHLGLAMTGKRPLRRKGALGRQRVLHRERGWGGGTKWQG